VPLSVAANAGWWITQGFGVQLHGMRLNEHVRFCGYTLCRQA
jgi:hypothetical protein